MTTIEEITKSLLSGNIDKEETNDLSKNHFSKKYTSFLEKGLISDYYKSIVKLDVGEYKHIDRLNLLNILVISLSTNKDKLKKDQYKFLVKETLKRWASPQEPDDIIGVVGDLFSFISCPIEVIKNVVSVIDDISPLELIESQIVNNNGLSINLVYERINLVFGAKTLTDEDILYLYQKSLDKKDSTLSRWIGGLIRKSKIKVPKPNWVDVAENETSILLDYDMWRKLDIKPEILKPNQEIENMMSNFNINDEDGNEIDKELINKTILAAYGAAPLETDKLYPCDIDRMFGPVNRKTNNECISGVIGGGCRLLTCRCRDFEDDNEIQNEKSINDPNGWFEGRCDECDKIITDISYAVRFPSLNGGWYGCYCSLEHMTLYNSKDINNLTETVISNMVGVIESKGIIDRVLLANKK